MITLGSADPDSPEAVVLLAELGAALCAITGDSGVASFDPQDVRGPRAVFLVARSADGTPVGCGALRPLHGDVAELKRMYARPGSDAGRHILAALEWYAVVLGYGEIWLSTRKVNRRAQDFYLRHGYVPVPAYGKYVGNPASACLGRWL
ncbi:GNAT family N-acetyltransferase [Massilia niastensis]|uniref:GNAT family N-acetyltransferase n=1 Tax=Massilia niastensis TaxID=544911 RepID=UPI00035E9791|nr:GNAT family N-acetyltransferase [Massilia niastensis]